MKIILKIYRFMKYNKKIHKDKIKNKIIMKNNSQNQLF